MIFDFLPPRDHRKIVSANKMDKEKMKSFLDYKNPALWITATVAAACIVPAVLVLKNPKRKAKNIFDWQYSVADVLYQASFYSSTCTPDTAPLYHFSGDRQLFVKDSAMDQDDGAEWQLLGRMEAITLSKTNFDDLFFTGPDRMISKIRKNTINAWQLDVAGDPNSLFYYLIQQKKGDLYLTFGYRTDEQDNTKCEGSIVRWLCLMKSDENE